MFKFRISFLIEISLLVAAVLAADHFFFSGDRFWGMHPHPFLFIILLVSAQYGTFEGLVAVVLCSLALLVGNLPEQTITRDIYDYFFVLLGRPMLWIGVVMVVGGFRDRGRKERKALKEKLDISRDKADVFYKAFQRLDKERNRLETHLSGQSCYLLSLHQVALNMKAVEPNHILDNMLDITQTVMKSEKCSWFLLNNSVLEVNTQLGWGIDENYSRFFISLSSIFQEVIGRHRVLCVTNAEDEKILDGQGMLAGPLVHPKSGKAYGMLKIEKLPFLSLNQPNVETFKILCEWLGELFEPTIQSLQERNQTDLKPEGQTFSDNYFERLSEFLSHLADNGGFKSHTLVIRQPPEVFRDRKLRSEVEKIIRNAAKTVIENPDLIFEGLKSNCEFILVLPDTSLEEARSVSETIKKALSQELEQAGKEKLNFSISINALGAKGELELECKG
ncbi:MAG: GAF domain-containing protein [Nitrospinaceae bacterium]